MNFTTDYKDKIAGVVAMFHQTFSASEGPEEGQIIKELVADMLGSVQNEDIRVFLAVEAEDILGGVIFSRLTYEQDTRTVFVLGPAAISTSHQSKGLGQRLINHGLQSLRENQVDVVLTYGDINYYSKVGFSHITEAEAQAPLPLQYPEGWLGQSLTGETFVPLKGPARCVAPLNDPNHW